MAHINASSSRTMTYCHTEIASLACAPDSALVAVGLYDGSINVFDTHMMPNSATSYAHKAPVCTVRFSPDGTKLVSISIDSTLCVWRVLSLQAGTTSRLVLSHHMNLKYPHEDRERKQVEDEPKERGVDPLLVSAWSPDGKTVAINMIDSSIQLMRVDSNNAQSLFKGHIGRILLMEFSPDGCLLASASKDGMVRIWDVVKGCEGVRYEGGCGFTCRSMAWTTDSKHLTFGSPRDGLCIVDAKTGLSNPTPSHRPMVTEVVKVACFPSGRHAIIVDSEGQFLKVELSTGRSVVMMDVKYEIYGAGFSEDMQLAYALGPENRIVVWEVDSGASMAEYYWPEALIISLTPNGKRLLTAGGPGTRRYSLCVWDVPAVSSKSHSTTLNF